MSRYGWRRSSRSCARWGYVPRRLGPVLGARAKLLDRVTVGDGHPSASMRIGHHRPCCEADEEARLHGRLKGDRLAVRLTEEEAQEAWMVAMQHSVKRQKPAVWRPFAWKETLRKRCCSCARRIWKFVTELHERDESSVDVLRGGVEFDDDVDIELERVEADGKARRDEEGRASRRRAGDALDAEVLLEVEVVPMREIRKESTMTRSWLRMRMVLRTCTMTSRTCTWTAADLNSVGVSVAISAVSLEKRNRTTRFVSRNASETSELKCVCMSVLYTYRESVAKLVVATKRSKARTSRCASQSGAVCAKMRGSAH